ncbi:MAG: ThiF family adenylyltransferase [Phenylobacterium sp.]|uniref:ThiF family adenylyltransferase n=1 Tax=Phenylobacterium sp. TaxID=1871053 RepID=UPI001B437E54|nr:ThiF family adenylyltransferase [Phenylobacterium sp.]MBP7648473.1 ThiF family adenylyltransferase [Phenylobacterium sp.]MBP7818051.1 ThiF family adenylyltransferase [Phenylobacterium sp.]MBP9753797.1 ThiF family adenylyltransferase [Phenylobacterium sp.]
MNILRMTGPQHAQLQAHLFPGDGDEAVAMAICGRAHALDRDVWMVHEIIEIPHTACLRGPEFVTWPTSAVKARLASVAGAGMAFMKIHSHPTGYRGFSERDDRSDAELFDAIGRQTPGRHVSAVMLPDGEIFARVLQGADVVACIDRVAVVGDDLVFHDRDGGTDVRDFDLRHRQAFGDKTTDLLSGLTVGIGGASGTGSPAIEMFARLGVARLVVFEPDVVEVKNLNRIYGATREDAEAERNKALTLKAHVERMGLGTEVIACAGRVDEPEAIQLMSVCDVIIGCMDSVEGRDTMNRACAFYTLPYLDIGVRLDADGEGGVSSVSAGVHFLRPGGSSLKSRGVYDDNELYAEYLKRTDPAFYDDQLKRGYIRGVRVDRPAVISINTAAAACAVNELLARLHPYRTAPNGEFAIHKLLFSHGRTANRPDGQPDGELAAWVGRGDCRPLLMCGRLDALA